METLLPLLGRCYLKSSFSPGLWQVLSHYQLHLANGILQVCFADKNEKFLAATEIHQNLLKEIGCSAVLRTQIHTVEFSYRDDPDPWRCRMSQSLAVEGLQLPILTEFEILAQINGNWQDVGGKWLNLPASLVSMWDGKPILVSNNAHISSGVTKAEMLRLPSNNKYFPPDELDRYLNAIISGRGGNVTIEYKAPQVNNPTLFQRRVEARLIRTEWGEVCRLVKLLEPPRPIA